MSIRRDEVNLTLTINGVSAGNNMRDLRKQAADLRRQLDRMDIGTKEWEAASEKLRTINGQMKAVKDAQNQVRNETDLWQRSMLKVTLVAGAIAAGFRALLGFASETSDAADEAAKQDAALKSRIISTNAAAGKSFEELKAQAEELAGITLFDDDQIKRGQELLLTFTNINGTVFDETIPILTDLSTTMKQDISTSAIQVGKALNDPIAGLKALSRIGVTFSEDQKTLIKRLVEMGDTAGAQRVILAELRKEFGGAAAAAAAAGNGGIQQITKRFNEVKETIGGLIIAFANRFSPAISAVVSVAERFANALTKAFSIPVSEKLREQQTEFNALVGVLQNVNSSEDTRNRAITELQSKYPSYIGNIDLHKASESDLNGILTAGNNLFARRIFLQSREEKILEFEQRRIDLQKEAFEAEKKLAEAQNRTNTGKGLFTLSKEQEVEKFQNVVSAQSLALQRLTDEQNVFLQEQDDFAKRFNIDTSTPTAATGVEATGGGNKSITAKAEKEAQAAAGSLRALREEVARLQQELDNSKDEVNLLAPLVKQLSIAEAALKSLEDRINALKNPTIDVAPQGADLEAGLAQLGGFDAAPAGYTDAELNAIIGFNDAKLADETLTIDEITLKRLEASKNYLDILEEEKQKKQELKDFELGLAETAANTFFSIQKNTLEQETQASIAQLDAQYAARIKSATGNSQAQAKLQAELEKKKGEIERAAAKKRRDISIKEAIIAGALAVIKALPNPVAAVAAGTAAFANLLLIRQQGFAGGGYTGSGQGLAADHTGHKPVGIVHANEWVSPPWMTNHPVYGRYVGALEAVRQRGYATGGFTTTPTVDSIPGPTGSSDSVGLAEMQALRLEFRQYAASVQAWQSRLRVAYTDIEDAGNDLGAVRADAAL
jgi:hypothetical protein